MRILITGSCGFVGSTLALEFLNAGHEVLGLDNLIRPGSEINRSRIQKAGVHFIHADIRQRSDFETLPKVDFVIDAAANPSVLAGVDGKTSSAQLIEHNLIGTLNMLEYCKRVQAGFILLSTSRVYSIVELSKIPVEPLNDAFHLVKNTEYASGLSSAGVAENFSTAAPISLYGMTKLASEQMALEYHHTFGLPVFINRCGVLAGAGQFGHPQQGIFSFWIHSWNANKPLKYIGFNGNGYQVRDALHPKDLIPLLLQQMSTPSFNGPRTLNLSGGTQNACSLKELSNWCSNRFGERTVTSVPETRAFDVPWLVLDSSLAEKTWHWKPKTNFHAILSEIADQAEARPDWLSLTLQQ